MPPPKFPAHLNYLPGEGQLAHHMGTREETAESTPWLETGDIYYTRPQSMTVNWRVGA